MIIDQEILSLNNDKKTLTDQEMLNLMEIKASEFTGIGGDLISAVGILVLSRFYGWRVMRLIASRRQWNVAVKIFGDIKKMTPERGQYARKSVGLAIADKLGDYWSYMRGQKNSASNPAKDRQIIIDVVDNNK